MIEHNFPGPLKLFLIKTSTSLCNIPFLLYRFQALGGSCRQQHLTSFEEVRKVVIIVNQLQTIITNTNKYKYKYLYFASICKTNNI